MEPQLEELFEDEYYQHLFSQAEMNAENEDEKIICKLDKIYVKILKQIDKTLNLDGYINPDGSVYVELKKAVYGLLQAARKWYDKLSQIILSLGYTKNPHDECVFNKIENGKILVTIYLYVDDAMIFATEQKFIDQLEIDLKKEFDNKVDFVKNALEFEFLSMKFDFRAKGLAHVTMKDYIIAILEEYNALLMGAHGTSLGYRELEFARCQQIVDENEPGLIHQDNKSTIHLIKNGKSTSKKTKHIKLRYFFIKEYLDDGTFEIVHCPTKYQISDILTKPLQGQQFVFLRDLLLGYKVM